MKRFRYITLILSLLMAIPFCAKGEMTGSWKLHTPFDQRVIRVTDTPDRTYFLGYAQLQNNSIQGHTLPLSTLFMYDKEGDEYRALNSQNILSKDIISTMAYNPTGKYLLVVYEDSDIDMVFDDGRVANIPALMSSSLKIDKSVSGINFDPANHTAYIATGFGYITINDEKCEVSESRNYAHPVTSVARMGDNIILSVDDSILYAPESDPRLSLSDYETLPDVENVKMLLPLSDTMCAFQQISPSSAKMSMLEAGGDGSLSARKSIFDIGYANSIYTNNYTLNRDGYLVMSASRLYQLTPDGKFTFRTRLSDEAKATAGSWDFKEFWFGEARKGYWSRKFDEDAQDDTAWTLTRQQVRPNAPAVYQSEKLIYSPRYGMLANNHGQSPNFGASFGDHSVLLSALVDDEWVMHGLPYTNPAQEKAMGLPNSILIDPDSPNYVYCGSINQGMLRMNLDDPEDILHMSYPSDPASGLPGFIAIRPDPEGWKHCQFSTPDFDRDGGMWSSSYDWDSKLKNLEIWYWSKDNRKATRDVASFRPWEKLSFEVTAGDFCQIQPLRLSSNVVLVAPNMYKELIMAIDHKGTPANQSDDKVVSTTTFYDQDGAEVPTGRILHMFEDENGIVWVAHQQGVFTINPRNIFTEPSRVSRIKVARNDGTSLADYLLDNATVNHIMQDPKGRKWFSTIGGGLVCTTGDGREILHTFTTDNSEIPSNSVFCTAYDPSSNSIMVATANGLAQYFPNGEGVSGEDLDSVKVSPNPVRPDYYGWVTIEGLTDNAVVKIADASGSIVADLGRSSGGIARWDATGRNGSRVSSGVYYVLASTGPDDKALGKVAKLLVMR